MTTPNPANDARTPPVAVWQLLEKLRGQDLVDWRVAPLPDRPTIADCAVYPYVVLAPEQGAAPSFAAGQHLPIRITANQIERY